MSNILATEKMNGKRLSILKNNFFSRPIQIYLIGSVVASLIFVFFEPLESRTADDTDTVIVNLTVTETISISSPADVNMAPDIAGTGISNGSSIWNIFTNCSSGWKMEVEASASPAMTGAGSDFTDYTEASAGVPETWSIAVADSEFGFTASGAQSEAKYSGGTLYEGFEGTTKIQVASDSSPTTGPGVDTTVGYRAEVGSSHIQPSGSYTATITATATTL